MIRRLLCWLGLHRAAPSVDVRWSLYFRCEDCHQVVPGAMAPRKR